MKDLNQEKDPIHVAVCSDDNYISFANAMMRSAIEMTESGPVHFHLINCGIKPYKVQKLKQNIENIGGKIYVYTPNNHAFHDLPTRRYGAAVYHRILLPEYIDSSISRILYLDCDILIKSDLGGLFNHQMGGLAVAAVENFSPWACSDIGLEREKYFNSGVLLLDLDQWRKKKIHEHVIEYANKYANNLKFVDQCSLNAVINGEWKRLHPAWNQQADIFNVLKKYNSECGYSKQQLKEAARSPSVIHFIGKKKPWNLECYHPYRHEFRDYLSKSAFSSQRLHGDTMRSRFRFYLSLRRHFKAYRQKHFV